MRDKVIKLLLCVLILTGILAGCGAEKKEYALHERISNTEAIVDGIRHGLKNHSPEITVRFDYGGNIFNELNEVVESWVEAALEDTDDPAEGDYIRYQYGGYTWKCSYTDGEDGRLSYKVTVTPVYFCTLTEEREASSKIQEILRSLAIRPWTAKEEKVRRIYAYITRHVRYDAPNRNNELYHKNATAYAAVITEYAKCQGFCTALYRMLREEGLECRIVTGSATGEKLHAWVIVELDGKYYNLDPTFDAGKEEWNYYLTGSGSFSDHMPGERFRETEFLNAYPVSLTDYERR